MFPVTRIYTDANGDTHFEDIEIPLIESGNIGRLSAAELVTGIIFREVDPGYDWNFHVAPQSQYNILVDGEIEIETSLGEKRIFKGGQVLLLEDTTGKGHRTRNIQPINRKSIFITLP